MRSINDEALRPVASDANDGTKAGVVATHLLMSEGVLKRGGEATIACVPGTARGSGGAPQSSSEHVLPVATGRGQSQESGVGRGHA